jgi:hypothetical protein
LDVWGTFGAAALAGAAAGLVFAGAWRLAFPPGVQSRFWIALSVLAQQTLTVDEVDEFLAIYKRLALTLGGYLGRNFGVMAVGGAALVAAMLLVLDPVQRAYDGRGGTLAANRPAIEQTHRHVDGKTTFQLGGTVLAIPDKPPGGRLAACWTASGCFGLSLLGFDLVELKAAPRGVKGPVIVRTGHGDVNPLFPYLSDLEGVFLAVFVAAMTAGILWPHKKGAHGPEPILKQSDFALVQINEQFKPLIRMLGDAETRRAAARLPRGPLDRPIFVTGLARSGTTTVLNALTRSRELGSHQYRDFPFLGAPLTWARVQGAIASEGAPVERPHKDRILITKLSADAFEEPLWQQFFPHVHDPSRSQRLAEKTSQPKFEAFFVDHLKKILSLRGAERYVSKGNYNVGRVEYLARLFPDARFVIPIRSPVEHVASLARQHELFTAYSAADPRVPLYLAAAGHYEFGPQRKAIVYSQASVAPMKAAYGAGDDVLAYALQWAEVYGHVAALKASPIGDRILVVRYEDLCADPAGGLSTIIKACALADPDGAIAAFAQTISVSEAPVPPAIEARRAEIWAVVKAVAEGFGYKG